MGLDPRSPGSWPEPKADAQPLSHPGVLKLCLYCLWQSQTRSSDLVQCSFYSTTSQKQQDNRFPKLTSPLSDTVEKRRPSHQTKPGRFKNSMCLCIESKIIKTNRRVQYDAMKKYKISYMSSGLGVGKSEPYSSLKPDSVTSPGRVYCILLDIKSEGQRTGTLYRYANPCLK